MADSGTRGRQAGNNQETRAPGKPGSGAAGTDDFHSRRTGEREAWGPLCVPRPKRSPLVILGLNPGKTPRQEQVLRGQGAGTGMSTKAQEPGQGENPAAW